MSAGSRKGLMLTAIALASLLMSSPATAQPVSLRSLAAQQVRLATIAYRIGQANGDRCESPRMLSGILLHDLSEYDPRVRPAVAAAFSLGSGAGVIQIVPGSRAEMAGLHVDDEILAIGGQSIVDPVAVSSRQKSYARVERLTDLLEAALRKGPTELLIRRAGGIRRVSLSGQPACGGETSLVNSGNVNAWSDGTHVAVTAGIMRLAQSDDELAFIIAHEIAHNILGHSRSAKAGIFGFASGISKARKSELAADAMAVKLMVDAGYAPTGGVAFLERARQRYWWNVSLDHPGFARRIEEVNSAMAALPRLQGHLPPVAAADAGTPAKKQVASVTGVSQQIRLADASPAHPWIELQTWRKSCRP